MVEAGLKTIGLEFMPEKDGVPRCCGKNHRMALHGHYGTACYETIILIYNNHGSRL